MNNFIFFVSAYLLFWIATLAYLILLEKRQRLVIKRLEKLVEEK